jgi:iron complex outermembrane receptor protein
MGRSLQGFNLLVVLTIAGGQIALAEAASAQYQSPEEQSFGQFQEQTTNDPIPRLSELERPATTIAEWMAQSSELVQITDIQLNATDAGVEIVLVSESGMLPVPSTETAGNTLIAEIPNAVLALPGEDEFQVFDPVEGIASIEAVTLTDSTVRLTIAGTEAPPVAEIEAEAQGLRLNVALGDATTPVADEEEIEIVVTAEPEDDYYVPDASTATRTDTPLRDIPQSIQAIPEQVIEDQQAIGLEEVVENVGGVTFLGNNDGREFNLAIRGFDNVPILRDGFRRFSGDSVEPEVANLERVDVLKGPASVLFGQAEPGGLVNLVTKQPLSDPFYHLQFQVGNRDFISPSIDLSGPLTADGRLLYRLNALYRHQDSFRDYDDSFDRIFVAPTLTWQIGEQTDLTVNLEYIEDDNPADFGTVAFGDGIADIPLERVTNNPDDTIEKDYLNVGYTLEHRFSENWQLRNQFRFISDDYEYDVLALPASLDESTGILTRVFAGQFEENDTYALYTNVQGNFNTGPVEHTLLFGVDLARVESKDATRFDFDPAFFSPLDIFDPDYSAAPTPPLEGIPIAFGSDITTDRLGIYLQDQIDILDNLIVLAGLRYDIVDRDTTDILDDSETNQYDDALTPRIGIVYQPIESISLYANYSRSFTPNFATDAQGEPLDPEEGEGFEVGIKANLIENRLSATLAYFDITKQNVATADPDTPFASVATGEQRSQGIDFDLIGEILPGWNIVASYAFIDAEVTEDNTDIVGNRLDGIPEHSASLWTTYEIQSGDLQGLGFGLGFNFVGERQGDLDNSFEVDSYFLTNVAVFYRRERWQVRLNVDNLFDVDFIESVGNSRVRGIYPGEPFTIRASVSVEL